MGRNYRRYIRYHFRLDRRFLEVTMSLWLRDPKSKKKSATLTLLVVGFITILGKLLLSDVTIHGVHFNYFSGGDFALAIGALGGLYVGRRFQSNSYPDNSPDDGRPPIDKIRD